MRIILRGQELIMHDHSMTMGRDPMVPIHACFARIHCLEIQTHPQKNFSKGQMPIATFIAMGTHRNAINPQTLVFVNFATCAILSDSRGTKKVLGKSLVNFRFTEPTLRSCGFAVFLIFSRPQKRFKAHQPV